MSRFITVDRAIIQAIQQASARLDITCTFYSDDWIVCLQKNGATHYIYGYAFDLNTQAASQITGDKVATYQLLRAGNVAAVPHFLVSSAADDGVDAAVLTQLTAQHGQLVIKPLRGSRGDFIAKVDSPQTALAHIQTTHEHAWAAAPFIDITREVRVVVHDNQPVLAYEKTNPVSINGLRMFNLNLGAKARRLDVKALDPRLATLATSAMQALHLRLGAVDMVYDIADEPQVLEVNTGFSLEHYAVQDPVHRTDVVALYERIIGGLFTQPTQKQP